MSDLDSSAKRLDAAMARLEAAVEKRGRRAALAEAEQQRLEQELAALRADFSALREASGGVSKRLDSAIGQLKLTLGDGA